MSDFQFKIIEGHQTLTSSMAFLLYELDQSFFPTPWGQDSWENLFLDHDRLLIVLQIKNQVIGLCLFDKSVGDSFAHLLKILIHPQYRNKGLSKKLLNMAFLKLESFGCSQLFLEVEEHNHAAQRLYLAMDFKIIHRKKDFYGTDRSGLIMTKTNKSHC